VEQRPTETKLYGGVQYSVSVPAGESRFIVRIGQDGDSIEHVIDCVDVSAGDYEELFKCGHQYAQKIIRSNDAGALPNQTMIGG